MSFNNDFRSRLEALLEKQFQDKLESLISRRFISLDQVTEIQGAIREIREVGAMCKRVSSEINGGKPE